VRGYATSLAQWWEILEQRGEAERWREVGVPVATGFLSWLRNGRTVEHCLVASGQAPAAGTLEARLAAVISLPAHPILDSAAVQNLLDLPGQLRWTPALAMAEAVTPDPHQRRPCRCGPRVQVRQQPPCRAAGHRAATGPRPGRRTRPAATGRTMANLRDRLLFALLAVEALAEASGTLVTKYTQPTACAPINPVFIRLLAYTGLRWG
jgi:hypothetical protein